MEIDACGDMNPYGSSAQEAYKYLTYWQFKKLVIFAFIPLFALEYFFHLIDIYNEKNNPKCFRKWDRGFGSKPNSFNYKEIIYYVISYSNKELKVVLWDGGT